VSSIYNNTNNNLTRGASFDCSCGNDRFYWIDIDGARNYADYYIDDVSLLTCSRCNKTYINEVSCIYFDITGDHDEYSTHYYPINTEGLAKLLVSLEDRYSSKEDSSEKRIFVSAEKWAVKNKRNDVLEIINRLKNK